MTGKKRPILDEFKLTELNQDDSEDLIQLVAMDDEHEQEEDAPTSIPILPIKNTVLFPGVVIPITVGRDKSISLIKEAYKGDRTIGVVAQKDPDIEDPNAIFPGQILLVRVNLVTPVPTDEGADEPAGTPGSISTLTPVP